MSTITTINASDQITDSRAVINNNFANLNSDKIETSVIDTDTALTANSDAKIPSQKAVKAYVDNVVTVNASESAKGVVEEATDAEVTAGTATGSTGAKLFITPTKLLTYLTSLFINRSYTFATIFETSARFTAVTSSGTNTYNTEGIAMDTTATGGRYAGIRCAIGNSVNNIFLSSPTLSISFTLTATANNFDSYFGLGTVTVAGSGHTYTTDHCGFKLLGNGSNASLYATQANGTTETASSALTTMTAGDTVELMLKINSTSSIDYYYRKNGASWSSATTLSTNLPDTSSNVFQSTLTNINTNQQTTISIHSMSYAR